MKPNLWIPCGTTLICMVLTAYSLDTQEERSKNEIYEDGRFYYGNIQPNDDEYSLKYVIQRDENKKVTCTDDAGCEAYQKCIEETGKGKFCGCPPGKRGDKCEIIDDCGTAGKYKDCKGENGECKYDVEKESAYCDCGTGKEWDELQNKCRAPCSNNCQNNGECKDEAGEKFCKCKPGTSGDLCETVDNCRPDSCGTNTDVKCVYDGTKEGVCKCDNTSKQFDKTAKACRVSCNNNCKNNGECKDEAGKNFCKCKPGTSGDLCETVDDCKPDSCGTKTDVKCVYDGSKGGVCKCDDTSKQFDEAAKACRVSCNNNCQNNGECKDEAGKKFCKCKPGTSGDLCETVDDCKPDSCGIKTDVKCVYDGTKGGVCKCDDTSKQYDKTAKECRVQCDGSNCNNEATCDKQGDLSFCSCKSGTSGDFCNTIYECEEGTLKRCKGENGKCVFKDGKTECQCSGEKKLDITEGQCRTPCKEKKECDHEGNCGTDGFCKCKPGTSGDACKTVDACVKDKEFCGKKENVECVYNTQSSKAECRCTEDKHGFDETSKLCRATCENDKDCGEKKTCAGSPKICTCIHGHEGEDCDVISGCKTLEKTCSKAEADCVYDSKEREAICQCKDEDYTYVSEKEGCKEKKCVPNPCGVDSKCSYIKDVNSTVCKCNDENKYYDYSTDKCEGPDICILKKTSCEGNRECKGGECKCIENYTAEGNETCMPNICKSKPCFTGANCTDTDGIVHCFCEDGKYFDGSKCADGSCFIGDNYKSTCTKPCPTNLEKKDGVCVPKTGFELCTDDCGYGYCVKKTGGNNTCSCMSIAYIETKAGGKCILNKDEVCASKKLTDDFTKCDCTDKKYKLSSNGITCDLKTCLDASAQNDCKQKGARCVMTKTGYDCKCHKGYTLDTIKNMCTDPCSQDSEMRGCLKTDQFCYNSISTLNGLTGDCKCPPTLKDTTGADKSTKCTEVAENVYVMTDIPVIKTRYMMNGKINHVLLNADLIQSMKSTFSKFDYGYLQDYELKDNILKVSVWIQFKGEPDEELNRIPLQAGSFKCEDCNSDLILWPPNLLLDKDRYKEVTYEKLEFCSDIPKNTLCGKEAICKDKQCSCPLGYKTVEYSIRDIKGKFRIERCEDIDECISETHNCTENTTCVNLPGDFYCQCKANFKKEEDPVHSRVISDKSDCYDLCTPNPCNKGTCVLKEDKSFDCKCPVGSEGSFCDNPDVSLASAKKSTAIVGSILGVILGLALIALFLLYRRMKKNSYSEDFSPAPRQDHASEMTERRPVRGMVNRAYE